MNFGLPFFSSSSELWLVKVYRIDKPTVHALLLKHLLGNIKATIKLGRLFQLQMYPQLLVNTNSEEGKPFNSIVMEISPSRMHILFP